MSAAGMSKPMIPWRMGLVLLAAFAFAAGSMFLLPWLVRHASEMPAFQRLVLWLAFAVAALLVLVTLTVVSFRWMIQRARHEHTVVREALRHARFEAPRNAVGPGAPPEPIGPGARRRHDWKKTAMAWLSALALLALLNLDWILRHFRPEDRWAGLLPLALLMLVPLAYWVYEFGRGFWVERVLKRGEYTKALRLIDGPLRWPASGLLRLTRGLILFYAGRQKEAEEALRGAVEKDENPAGKALALRRLGHVLMAQERYEEAARTFESAVRILPQNAAASSSGLAEIKLRQEIEPAQALALAERALEAQRTSLLARRTARERFGEIRGNQAWALALLGRVSDAAGAIAAGLRETDLTHQPELAGFHWRGGMAMAAAGSLNTAIEHFRRAREIDPEGYYGGLATEQLRRHSVWGAVGSSCRE